MAVAAALPDERECIWVSTKLCIFCKRGRVVLHFWIEIEWLGKQFSCCAQGTDQSSCEAWRSSVAVLVSKSVCSRFGSILLSSNELRYCLQEVTLFWACCVPVCLRQCLNSLCTHASYKMHLQGCISHLLFQRHCRFRIGQ